MRSCDLDNRNKIVEVVTTPTVRNHLYNEYGVDIIPLKTKNELRLFFKGNRVDAEPFNAATNIKGLLTPFSGAFENIKNTIWGAELVLYFNSRNAKIVEAKINALKASEEAWNKKRELDFEDRIEAEQLFTQVRRKQVWGVESGDVNIVDGEVVSKDDVLRNLPSKKNTYDRDVRKKYFPNKIESTKNVIEKIINSSHPLNQLAKILLPYTSSDSTIELLDTLEYETIGGKLSNGRPFAGLYVNETDKIYIHEGAAFRGLGSEITILHEIIHQLTYKKLKENTKIKNDFNSLYQHAFKYLAQFNEITGSVDEYALSDLDEFMTGIFTDGAFIKKLESVPPLESIVYKNFFEELFAKILALFKITKRQTFYEQAVSVASGIIVNAEVFPTYEDARNQKELDDEVLNNILPIDSGYIKEGVDFVFESNPELFDIGTQKQYSQYLDTIFPDSRVRDIVYHGTKGEKFDTVDISKSKFNKGFYFAKDKSIAEGYGNIISLIVDSKNIQTLPYAHFGYYVQTKKDLFSELDRLTLLKNKGDFENALALQSIDIVDEIQFFNTKEEKEEYRKSNSGWSTVGIRLINEKIKEVTNLIGSIEEHGEFDTMLTHNDDYQLSLYAVGKPEQIHILGSKQDIEGFKKFVNNKIQTNSRTYGPNYLFNTDYTMSPEEPLPLSNSNSDFKIPCIIK